MRVNVKIDQRLLDDVKKVSVKGGQKISGYIELAVEQALRPRYPVLDNSDAFRKYLTEKGIKYEGAGHITVLVDVADPMGVGIAWGTYKALNSPHYKDSRPA